MDKKQQELLARHVAGATVSHTGVFDYLSVPKNDSPLDVGFLKEYVAPFYMKNKDTEEFRHNYTAIRETIKLPLVVKLLADFNWRSRSVGAYFSALEDYDDLLEPIGNLLLRSEVCYAGHQYCLALASFGSNEAVNYLNDYLTYYLKRPDLWFDQSSAMAALSYIGKREKIDYVDKHMSEWSIFIKNKPNWNLLDSIDSFDKQMYTLSNFRSELGN